MKNSLTINTKDFGGYKNFHALLNRIKPFIFPDETRFNLNGIFFELKSKTTTLTATNGDELYTEIFDIKNNIEGNFTLSLEGVKEILKIKQDCVLEVDGLEVKVLGNKYKWIIKAGFPEYEKLVFSALTTPIETLSYTKEDLNSNIKTADKKKYITFKLKNKEAKEIILNGFHLENMMKAIFSNVVNFEIFSYKYPAVVQEGDKRIVLFPSYF